MIPIWTNGLCGMFDYSYLETLYAVETEGTYEKAAKSRGVSRSAISQSIKSLEDRWKAPTVSRKPIKPTRWGRRLCRHVDQVRLLETALFLERGDMFDINPFEPTPIQLLFDTKAIPTCLLDAITCVADSSRSFMFQTNLTSSHQLQHELSLGSIKSAISTQKFAHPDLFIEEVGTVDFVPVASPAFVSTEFGSGVDKSKLINAPSLAYSKETNYCAEFVSRTYGEIIETRTNALPSNYSILNACLGGKGWAMLPKSSIQRQLKEGSLRPLFFDQTLSITLFWYVSKFIQTILPDVSNTVLADARQHLSNAEPDLLLNTG